jgi:hypothetical protein
MCLQQNLNVRWTRKTFDVLPLALKDFSMALGDIIGSTLELIVGFFDAWDKKKSAEPIKPAKQGDDVAIAKSAEDKSDVTRYRKPQS